MALSARSTEFLIKTGVFLALGVGGFFAVRAAIKSIRNNSGKQASERTVFDYSNQIANNSAASAQIEKSATINRATAKTLASKIKNAWGGIWNDDEDAVYAALQQLQNDADLQLVIQEYGIYKDEDLISAVQSRMSSSEVAKCNSILSSKGIQQQF